MALMSVEQRFSQVRGEYEALKERCEAQVVTWRWATFDMFGEGPYHFERHRWGRGKWLASKPNPPQDHREYGFDAQGRVVVERQWIKVGDWPLECHETFTEYSEDRIDSAMFDRGSEKEPINVRRYTLREGRVVLIEGHAKYGNGTAAFTYDAAGLPETLVEVHREPGRETRASEYRFTHDALGRLALIEFKAPGGWMETWRKPNKKESPKALAALIEARLLEQIPIAVAAAKVTEAAYGVLLAYDWESSECLPPMVAVGLESERRHFVEEHGKKADSYLWNPAELKHFDLDGMTLDDGPLLAACSLLTQQLADKDNLAPATKLLIEVASKLNALDWSKVLNVTEDFLVVPVDLEGAHVKRNLAAVKRARRLTFS